MAATISHNPHGIFGRLRYMEDVVLLYIRDGTDPQGALNVYVYLLDMYKHQLGLTDSQIKEFVSIAKEVGVVTEYKQVYQWMSDMTVWFRCRDDEYEDECKDFYDDDYFMNG